MLNVCHIVSGDLWAGAEVMAYTLLRGLCAFESLSLSAILLNEGRLADELRKLGIRVHVASEKRLSFFGIFNEARKALGPDPPDVIHSHRYKENVLACLLAASFRTPKLIGTQHGMPEIYDGNKGLKHRIVSQCNFSILSNFFHRTVGVSQNIGRAFIEHYGFREDKICVIHNGIEMPDHETRRERREETFVIGSVGRLCPVKDYPLMVEIAGVLSEKSGCFRFRLAGDGPDKPKLRDLIERYHLNGNFELKGHLDEMAPFYEGLDLYLNTSVHEGIPMSVLEAMAHGLPVIAPNVGGLGEIVEEGKQGYLLRERRPEKFAEKCLLLKENEQLRQGMSRAAREKVAQSFSMESMAHRHYDVYKELCSSIKG